MINDISVQGGGWTRVPLHKIAEVVSGTTPSSGDESLWGGE